MTSTRGRAILEKTVNAVNSGLKDKCVVYGIYQTVKTAAMKNNFVESPLIEPECRNTQVSKKLSADVNEAEDNEDAVELQESRSEPDIAQTELVTSERIKLRLDKVLTVDCM